MNASETFSKKLASLKEQAKMLTSDIASVRDRDIVKNLHASALDLLLAITEIERDTKHLIVQRNRNQATAAVLPATATGTNGNITASNQKDLTEQEKIEQEIKKVRRKLPRWAKNPDQINSQILILFLTLQTTNGSERISESELKEAYENDYEFYRNFNQMKTISPKNHGKVFHVRNGLIEIWEPVKDIVNTFRNEIQEQLKTQTADENTKE